MKQQPNDDHVSKFRNRDSMNNNKKYNNLQTHPKKYFNILETCSKENILRRNNNVPSPFYDIK